MEKLIELSPGHLFLDVEMDPAVYDDGYYRRYAGYRDTAMGAEISEFRRGFASRYGTSVYDVGIGCGAFLEACIGHGMPVKGYDVNPSGVAWLRERGLYHDPYADGFPALDVLTLWDVIEHFRRPGDLLDLVPSGTVVCLTVPIWPHATWTGIEAWKHYRPDEHYHMWTDSGFVRWMSLQGYVLLATGDREVELGRSDVATYAFEKI